MNSGRLIQMMEVRLLSEHDDRGKLIPERFLSLRGDGPLRLRVQALNQGVDVSFGELLIADLEHHLVRRLRSFQRWACGLVRRAGRGSGSTWSRRRRCGRLSSSHADYNS